MSSSDLENRSRSSDLENRSRLTKFNRLLSLPMVNLDVKYEHPGTKTLDCRAVTRVKSLKTDKR